MWQRWKMSSYPQKGNFKHNIENQRSAFLCFTAEQQQTKSAGRLTLHSSCRRWGHLSSPSHRAALRGRKKQMREMKSVYSECRGGDVQTKLNQWGETTWISESQDEKERTSKSSTTCRLAVFFFKMCANPLLPTFASPSMFVSKFFTHMQSFLPDTVVFLFLSSVVLI